MFGEGTNPFTGETETTSAPTEAQSGVAGEGTETLAPTEAQGGATEGVETSAPSFAEALDKDKEALGEKREKFNKLVQEVANKLEAARRAADGSQGVDSTKLDALNEILAQFSQMLEGAEAEAPAPKAQATEQGIPGYKSPFA